MDTRCPSMRVLVRPASTPPRPLLPQPSPTSPDPPSTSPQNGITVVGFVGKCHEDVAHLINKIIDSNVFGFGNLDRSFPFDGGDCNPEIDKWLRSRILSFYQNKGILYLQFSTSSFPETYEGLFETRPAPVSVFEDHKFGDIQVCHIIILVEEGSRFDTQLLKKFRLLQAAKQSIAPFIRPQNELPQTSRSHSSASSTMNAFGTSINNPSPGKSRGILKRNASTSMLISGLGSYTSLLPGQCTPVVLFVFLDDFDDIQHSSKMEEPAEASSLNLSSSSNSARPSLPMKGSSYVVVLARPANKSEGGVRKRIRSSLEAQIRFSIKKCRTLSGSESGHTGSRRGEILCSSPLFFVDASKVVSLVDAVKAASSSAHSSSCLLALSLALPIAFLRMLPPSHLQDSYRRR